MKALSLIRRNSINIESFNWRKLNMTTAPLKKVTIVWE
uniref:Uncharacterized protein n=1 Tax=Siphoviridae sp. ctZHD14 TaxID=2827891 RepID=A0A8S5SW54_9CAUD|nr:MAG TPA: hypothetical protein [Siphoviridae sp. ctZHD14]